MPFRSLAQLYVCMRTRSWDCEQWARETTELIPWKLGLPAKYDAWTEYQRLLRHREGQRDHPMRTRSLAAAARQKGKAA